MSDEEELPLDGIFTDLGAATPKPVKWVIQDLLPSGLTVLGGPPKSDKSTLSMAMVGLVAGLRPKVLPPFLSVTPEHSSVLVFSYEADAGELRQMAEDGCKMGVPDDKRILIADDPWMWRLDDSESMAALLHYLNAREPLLVVLDPLRDCHDQDENDSAA